MNMFDLLVDQHKEVKTLLKELITECEKEEKVDKHKCTRLVDAVKLHTRIEETHLYPRAEEVSRVKDLVEESYEEHREVDALLEKLEEHQDEAGEAAQYLKHIQIALDHHIGEEENAMFPTLKNQWSDEEIDQITEKVQGMVKGAKSSR